MVGTNAIGERRGMTEEQPVVFVIDVFIRRLRAMSSRFPWNWAGLGRRAADFARPRRRSDPVKRGYVRSCHFRCGTGEARRLARV